MPKKKCCKDSGSGDIPSWFMTYSDVITLLMTFFILLLTFASNQPEFFSQVQVVAFGGGGSTGMAAESDSFIDANVPVLRFRPTAARITTTGTETPPMETDLARETLSKGLESLKQPNLLADSERIRLRTPMSLMRDDDGLPTQHALMQMELLAPQLLSMPIELGFRTSSPEDTEFCVNLAVAMFDQLKIPLGRISVSEVSTSTVGPGQLEMLITRQDLTTTR